MLVTMMVVIVISVLRFVFGFELDVYVGRRFALGFGAEN